jgi:hypothetical protein
MVLLPHGAFLEEDHPIFTPGTAEPLGVSPPEAVDLHLIKKTGEVGSVRSHTYLFT